MDIYVYLEKGIMNGKTEMEDRVVVGKNVLSSGFHHFCEITDGFVAVMDGVGGVPGSSYASSYVAYALSQTSFLLDQEGVRQVVLKMHQELCAGNKTATTLTGLYVTKSDTTLLHIGNTRLSVLKNGYLVRFTEDQTEGEQLLKEGIPRNKISEESFRSLNACIGFDDNMLKLLQVQEYMLVPENIILLTSDGIHDYLKEEDFELALKKPLSEAVIKEIAQMSRIQGSEDDISIIVIKP